MLRDDRMLLKITSVDNLSVREIASISRISKSTVHRRINYIFNKYCLQENESKTMLKAET